MAKTLRQRLAEFGIGVKGEIQKQREADPYLMAIFNRQPLPARAKRNAPIEERQLAPYEDMYGEPARSNIVETTKEPYTQPAGLTQGMMQGQPAPLLLLLQYLQI